MNEQIQLLRSYVRMVWPHRWLALMVSTVVALIGWTMVYLMPNQYEVTAKVFIDTRSMLRPVLQGLAIDNRMIENSAALMRRTLLTRPNLEEVARKTDMDLKAPTPKQFDALVEGLAANITLTGTSTDNIFEIIYTDTDKQFAKRLVDELLNTFLESTLGDTRKDTVVTQKFLDDQIAEYERKLIEAEDRLKEFKRKNLGLMPGEGETYYQNLQRSQTALAEAKLALQEATQRRDELRRQVEGDEPVLGYLAQSTTGSPLLRQLEARRVKVQERLDDLLLQFTDKHPDVVGARETLEQIERERDREIQRLAEEEALGGGGDMVSAGVERDPMFQEMKLALAQAEAEVAALQSRVTEFDRRLAELSKLVNTVPEVEAELTRLDRDYGLNKRQFEELLKRREATRISEEADKTSDDIKIKVIEPPRVPLIPSGPDRLRLVSLVFVVALALGAATAVLLSQVNPRVHTSDELKALTGIPVLGTISLLQSVRQRTERRMEIAFFGTVLLVLIGVYGGLLTLQTMNVDVHGGISKLLGSGP